MKKALWKTRLGLAAAVCLLLSASVWADDEKAVPLTDSVEEGDLVHFGMFEQDADDSSGSWKELEWRVLDCDDGEALLITEKCIAAMPYEQAQETTEIEDLEVTWETCSLREWLNQSFFNIAFSEKEQDCILATTVITPDNGDIDGGEDTDDRIFLLSGDEARDYFKRLTDRRAKATERAMEGDVLTVFVSDLTDDTVFWWLRSPGSKQECAQLVGAEGTVAESGYLVSRLDIGVRPVMWVELPGKEIKDSGGDRDYEKHLAEQQAAAQQAAAQEGAPPAGEDAGGSQDGNQEADGVLSPDNDG